jgi:hypothetical protein
MWELKIVDFGIVLILDFQVRYAEPELFFEVG